MFIFVPVEAVGIVMLSVITRFMFFTLLMRRADLQMGCLVFMELKESQEHVKHDMLVFSVGGILITQKSNILTRRQDGPSIVRKLGDMSLTMHFFLERSLDGACTSSMRNM